MRVKDRVWYNRLAVGDGGNNLPAGTGNKQESEMKTPTAILLGLALIAAAIFFREPSGKPAHAALGGIDGFACSGVNQSCTVIDGDIAHTFSVSSGNTIARNWKTGKRQ